VRPKKPYKSFVSSFRRNEIEGHRTAAVALVALLFRLALRLQRDGAVLVDLPGQAQAK
jgi:hypothetical protein